MFKNDLFQCFHLLPAIQVTSWIIRLADNDGLCFRRNRFFKSFRTRSGKTRFDSRSDWSYNSARGYGEPIITSIKGSRNDKYVSGTKTTHKAKQTAIRTPTGNYDLGTANV